MGVPEVKPEDIGEITIALPDDISGASVDLREWLASAGPDAQWRLLTQQPSDGQGPAETIGLLLGSSASAVTLYDRIREWLTQRKPHDTQLLISAVIELDGKKYQLAVSLEPAEDGNDGPA